MNVLTRTFRSWLCAAGLLMGGLATVTGAGAAQLAALPNPAPDPNELVRKADRIRFPEGAFQVDITITSVAPGKDPEVRDFRVLNKGHENSLVMTLAPASERGTILLMKETDLWVFVPAVSQPVRLPLSQRLTGQVANGDLARANFAGDYDAELLGVETINDKDYYKLELTASRRGVTYHRVLYWLAVEDNRPYKAEFYTVSNRLMKTCYYRDFAELGGAIRPTRMLMVDALKQGERSVMDYSAMAERAIDDKVFSKNYLKKLQ